MECLLSEALRNSGMGRCRWMDQSNLAKQCREQLGKEEGGRDYPEARKHVDARSFSIADSLFAGGTRANHERKAKLQWAR